MCILLQLTYRLLKNNTVSVVMACRLLVEVEIDRVGLIIDPIRGCSQGSSW